MFNLNHLKGSTSDRTGNCLNGESFIILIYSRHNVPLIMTGIRFYVIVDDVNGSNLTVGEFE